MTTEMATFISTATSRDVLAKAWVRSVWLAYVRWCVRNDHIPESPSALNRALQGAGYVRSQGRFEGQALKMWKGLKLMQQ
jgi:hypothetical protein